jgi:hypothetical protein
MQSQFRKICLVATVMLLASVAIANAFGSSGSGFTDGTTFFPASVRVNASGASGTCSVQNYTGFYQWNLSSISDTANVQSATITLTKYTTAGSTVVPQPSALSIYAASSDTLAASTVPTGQPLATIENIVDPVPSTLTFATTTALADYIESQLADNTATFALRWSQCAVGASGGADVVIRLMTTADLTLGTTAVTLSTFQAADPAVNWPLIAGLGALAAVVIGGLAVTRRRAAGR